MSLNTDVSSWVFTLANLVSVIRLMAIPVFLYLVIADRLLAAFILLVAAVLTDFVDGLMASQAGSHSGVRVLRKRFVHLEGRVVGQCGTLPNFGVGVCG